MVVLRVPIIMSFQPPSGRPGKHLLQVPVDFRPAHEAVCTAAALQDDSNRVPLAIYAEIPWVEAVQEDGSTGRARPARIWVGPCERGTGVGRWDEDVIL